LRVLPKVLLPIRSSNGDCSVLEAEASDIDWPELRTLWRNAKIGRPLCFAPPEEKLDVFFSYACQKAGLPISLGTVFNPGWTDMFLSTIKHDCLVISSELASYLSERGLFGAHLGLLEQIVIVGDLSQHVRGSVSTLIDVIAVHILPHPAKALML